MNRFSARVWTLLAALLLSLAVGASAAEKKTEPTNAAGLAQNKAAAEKAIDEKFAAWKASLPPAQQKWETLLEQNLGAFYLPLYKREKVAGRVSSWDYVVDDPRLPRVLLIGDSISRGYTLAVRKRLAGKANIHRAPENCGPTANALKKLDIWLGEGQWDVIHFNFGIHDRKTPLADYEQRLETIIQRLKKTGAKLVWATTTPVAEGVKSTSNADLVARNAVAARLAAKHGLGDDDLYAHVLPKLAEYQNPADVHFNTAGYNYLGEQVATSVLQALKRQ